MYKVKELVTLAKLYQAHTGMKHSRLSKLACGHNRLFERLYAGHGCHSENVEQASEWFRKNWPADLPWPEHISRCEQIAA